MRLIDADGVIKEIEKNKLLAREPATVRCVEIIKNATTYVQPTTYDVDKVVEKLVNTRINVPMSSGGMAETVIPKIRTCDAIEIVRKGGVDESTK